MELGSPLLQRILITLERKLKIYHLQQNTPGSGICLSPRSHLSPFLLAGFLHIWKYSNLVSSSGPLHLQMYICMYMYIYFLAEPFESKLKQGDTI